MHSICIFLYIDMPPNVLHTDSYVEECQQVVAELQALGHNVSINVIRGDELTAHGLNGLFGVGQAAVHPASLVHMSYTPPNTADDAKSVCLVGKGIVYDSGGLGGYRMQGNVILYLTSKLFCQARD